MSFRLSNSSLKGFQEKLPKKEIVTIDYGNSNPHRGYFSDGKLIEINRLAKDWDLLKEKNLCFISSVSKDLPNQFDNLWRGTAFLGMPVHYSSSLGQDRLLIASYIYQALAKEALIIDAGTFLTIDLVTKDGFMGGWIFPGPTVYLNSYGQGERLPNLTTNNEKTSLPCPQVNEGQLPKNTEEAILFTVPLYLKGIISEVLKRTNHKTIIITGGSSDLVEKALPNEVEIIKEPHLIHYALYFHGVKVTEE